MDPTKVQPGELLRDFKGLNDNVTSVDRPKGTVSDERNIFDEQVGDANRRYGRDFERLESDAIGIIFGLSWDDGSITTIVSDGSDIKYNTFTYPDVTNGSISSLNANPATPGPMPNFPWFLPFIKNTSKIPDLTSYMRAISEAYRFATVGSDFTWPTRVWAYDVYEITADSTTLINTGIRSKDLILEALSHGYKLRPSLAYGAQAAPVNGTLLESDFYYCDYFMEGEFGIATDLETIRVNYNTTLTNFVKATPINGNTTNPLPNYVVGDRDSVVVTASNWKDRAPIIASNINNNLLRFQVAATATVTARKVTQVSFTTLCATHVSCIRTNHPSTAFGNTDVYTTSCTVSSSTPLVASGRVGQEAFIDLFNSPNTYALSNNRGTIAVDLTNYPAAQCSAECFLFISRPGNFGVYPSQVGLNFPTNYSSDFSFASDTTSGTWGVWQQAGLVAGANNTTGIVTGSDVDAIASGADCSYAGLIRATGWGINTTIALLTRSPQLTASPPFSSGGAPSIITPDEYFTLQTSQTVTTTETSISWGAVKLTDQGAASRDVYPQPTVLGGQTNYTPSTSIQFSSNAPGFEKRRFLNPNVYRPFILCQLQLNCTIRSGSPTALTVKMYINNTLVRTTTSVPVNGGLILYGFSILNLGTFSEFRPPDNDSNNDLEGWPNPSMRISVATDTGEVQIISTTKLYEIVMQYPV